jgi:hydroxymethylbilane synthase
MTKVIIGSRGSELALWQAHHVTAQLEALGCEVELKIIKTQGDIIQHLSFDKMEGKGFFTKEIEAALLDKSIDLAVHSHKDLETNSPDGLVIAAVSEREDPSDLLLIRKEAVNTNEQFNLKSNGIVGTSSARRKAQMMRFRPDVEIKDLRGNVPTRIQKLRDGHYDAILLARAGVSRLQIDLSEFEVVVLDPREFIPAPAQGVLGLQIREKDTHLAQLLQQLDTPDVRRRIGVERAVLNQLEGGCQLPLGVYCPDDHHVYVSFSTNWEEGASWEEYQVDDLDGVAELIVQDLKEGLEEE